MDDVATSAVETAADVLDEHKVEHGEAYVEYTTFGTGLLVFLLFVWVTGGHYISTRYRYIGEASMASLMGLGTGIFVLFLKHFIWQDHLQRLLIFSTANFFTFLLPPIIFYAGLSCRQQHFFQNLPSIFMFGVLGTFVAFLVLSATLYGFSHLPNILQLPDCLAMGAIFAATDSVATLQILSPVHTPQLYSLVFGEGVLNDATSIVIMSIIKEIPPDEELDLTSGAVKSMIWRFITSFTFSVMLGGGLGLAASYALRFLKFDLPSHAWGNSQQMAFVSLIGYFSYLAADFFGLSGILSLFTCALAISHFGLYFLNSRARLNLMGAFKTISYICEGIIFIFLGMDTLDPVKWSVAYPFEVFWMFIVLSLLLIISRAIFVVPFTALHNLWATKKLDWKDTVAIWWSGLVRGAVSIALVYYYFDPLGISDNPHRATLIVTTLLICLASTMLFGAATRPLIKDILGIKTRGGDDEATGRGAVPFHRLANEAPTSHVDSEEGEHPLALSPTPEPRRTLAETAPRGGRRAREDDDDDVGREELSGGFELQLTASDGTIPLERFDTAVRNHWGAVNRTVHTVIQTIRDEADRDQPPLMPPSVRRSDTPVTPASNSPAGAAPPPSPYASAPGSFQTAARQLPSAPGSFRAAAGQLPGAQGRTAGPASGDSRSPRDVPQRGMLTERRSTNMEDADMA